MAADQAKVDPMKQFAIEAIGGTQGWEIAGFNIAFTNSAMWMLITTVVLFVFVLGGMKRELVPGRWQMMVETFTGFIDETLYYPRGCLSPGRALFIGQLHHGHLRLHFLDFETTR